MTGGTVIIGASQSGVQLASSLREHGYDSPITLIDSALHEPYQRPPLSKAYLHGTVDAQGLRFRTQEYYESHGIALALGSAVTEVSWTGEREGHARTANGSTFPFEHLAIAVGAAPRRLGVEGEELDGVFSLRDADDAAALKEALDAASDVVVIGGGFIGLEVAASARKAGKSVVVLEAAPRIIGRAVGDTTSSWFLDAHRRRGLRIEIGAQVRRIEGADGRVTGVELADGTRHPADVVVVGVGVIPRTELAEQLGLRVENGIVVDEHSLASDGRTIAIGDVANLPNPFSRSDPGSRIRLESVNNAVEQARNAALTITGQPSPYRLVPWFWSDQGDLKLQMAGLSMGHDRVVIRGNPDAEKFSVLYYVGDLLIGADCVNSPLDFMAVKQLLAKNQNVPPEAAGQDAPLKTLVVDVVAS
jgi:3-phenylpropionate/trans-cinnamate dioxygenase ferredoxin reductase subunit